MLDFEKLGITEKVLIDNGFSVGTAYNILKGKISKRSLIKLYETGLISKVDIYEKYYCSNNNLFGEYTAEIVRKELVIIDDNYKIRLIMKVNGYDLFYILDVEDVILLENSGISILDCSSVVVKVVGKKVNFIKWGA